MPIQNLHRKQVYYTKNMNPINFLFSFLNKANKQLRNLVYAANFKECFLSTQLMGRRDENPKHALEMNQWKTISKEECLHIHVRKWKTSQGRRSIRNNSFRYPVDISKCLNEIRGMIAFRDKKKFTHFKTRFTRTLSPPWFYEGILND